MSFTEKNIYTATDRARAAEISIAYRRKYNLSQEALAKQLNTQGLKSCCQSYVSGLETGRFTYSNAFLKSVLELEKHT